MKFSLRSTDYMINFISNSCGTGKKLYYLIYSYKSRISKFVDLCSQELFVCDLSVSIRKLVVFYFQCWFYFSFPHSFCFMKTDAVTECIDINNDHIFILTVAFSSIRCPSLSHLILFDMSSTLSANKIRTSVFFFFECLW